MPPGVLRIVFNQFTVFYHGADLSTGYDPVWAQHLPHSVREKQHALLCCRPDPRQCVRLIHEGTVSRRGRSVYISSPNVAVHQPLADAS